MSTTTELVIESILESIYITKKIDHPIVDHLGQLFSRTKKNRRDEDEYELVKDVPILRYSPLVNSHIAITEVDGRLYDVKNSKYLVVHGEEGPALDLSGLSFKSVIVSALKNMMLALTDNGDLYRATIDTIIHSFELIDRNVQFVTRGYQDDLVSVRGNRFDVYDEEATICLGLPEGEEVIDVQPGILITRNHLVVLRDGGGITAIKYVNRLICCGTVMIYDEYRDRDQLYVAIMEEENGELITRFCDPYHYRDVGDVNDENNEDGEDVDVENEVDVNENNEDGEIDDENEVDVGENNEDGEVVENEVDENEVYNSQLVRMHRQSPWIEIIIINRTTHLLNRDGVTLEIREDWATIGTKIPFNILSTNNRTKSMR